MHALCIEPRLLNIALTVIREEGFGGESLPRLDHCEHRFALARLAHSQPVKQLELDEFSRQQHIRTGGHARLPNGSPCWARRASKGESEKSGPHRSE